MENIIECLVVIGEEMIMFKDLLFVKEFVIDLFVYMFFEMIEYVEKEMVIKVFE